MFGFVDLLSCAFLVVFFTVVLQYCTGSSFGKHFTKFSPKVGGADAYVWFGGCAPGASYAPNPSNDMVDRYQLFCHQLAMARQKIELLQTEIQDLDEENQRLYNANVRMKKQYKRNREVWRQSAEKSMRKKNSRYARMNPKSLYVLLTKI